MPRKRRQPKRRLPAGLAEISLCERTLWHCAGPLLEADRVALRDHSMYHVWQDWPTWATFYGEVRLELYANRPWRRETSCAERLYEAFVAGEDPEAVRVAMRAEAAMRDPRRALYHGGR